MSRDDIVKIEILDRDAEDASVEAAGNTLDDVEPDAVPVPVPASEADVEPADVDLKDRWLRAEAELDNLRKRIPQDLQSARRQEREAVLRELLGVVDNLERALEGAPIEESPWLEGVAAIHQQMLGLLGQFGVEPFVSTGERFDPDRHEAVSTIEAADHAEGSVVEELQVGYESSEGGILRHSKVVVAK